MSNRTVIRTVITPRAITRRVGPAGAGGGATTFAALTDKATADLPAINTPLSSALSGKQPLDADLTSWAGVTRAAGFDTFTATPSSANLRSLVTDETGSGALVFGTLPTLAGFSATGAVTFSTGTTFTYGTGAASAHRTALGLGTLATQSGNFSGTSSGTNTGDQDLSGLLPRLSRITVTGTTPAFPDPLVEQPYLSNGKREWRGLSGSYLLFDSGVWNLYHFDGVDDYSAYSISTTTNEPWEIPSDDWFVDRGTGAPVLTIDTPALLPVSGASGTIALSTDQQGRVAPADMTGLGTGVATALGLAANAANGFPTANGAGRTALGSGATGDAIFRADNIAQLDAAMGITTLKKAADTSLTSSTLATVSDFTFAVVSGVTYRIWGELILQSVVNTIGFKSELQFPAIDSLSSQWIGWITTPTGGMSAVGLLTTGRSNWVGYTGVAAFRRMAFDVTLRFSAAGNVTIVAAQNTTDAANPSLVKARSFLKYQIIDC